jgi:hypothetical protein
MMTPQILMQRFTPRIFEQRPQHQIAAAALGEVVAVFLAQGFDSRVAVLAIDFTALVTVASVKSASFPCHVALLRRFE